MDQSIPSIIEFVPAGILVNAQLAILSTEQITRGISQTWWNDPALKTPLVPSPIDRAWQWEEMEIQYEGQLLASEKVGVITGDGYIQGAMLISSEPIKSTLARDSAALFVELLFTAPRNRPALRVDGQRYFSGVGPELLRWAVLFSRRRHCDGRLKLDASPDYFQWYLDLGFQKLDVEPIIYEGIKYTPMELPAEKVDNLLSGPNKNRKRARK